MEDLPTPDSPRTTMVSAGTNEAGRTDEDMTIRVEVFSSVFSSPVLGEDGRKACSDEQGGRGAWGERRVRVAE